MYYGVITSKNSTTNSMKLGSSTLQANITGLLIHMDYYVSVSASTKAGEGPKSDGILVKTGETGKFINCS